ncbi:MAG: type 4a pilus biogenesis protein PilO [Nitrospirae bacterium]|nr:type 4a pilus biogenesis protein PilO [Nitrospirota bacterium]
MDIKTIRNRIKGLSQREKIISAATITAAVVIFFHMILYSPAAQKLRLKQQSLQNLKREIEAITVTLSSQAVPRKEHIPEKISLPEADDLSGMLAGISREATRANVDFISIAPEAFEHKNNFIELRVKMEMKVRFRELYDFLRIIETKHKLFLIQDLKFETNNTLYPSGVALLKAVTYLKKKQ